MYFEILNHSSFDHFPFLQVNMSTRKFFLRNLQQESMKTFDSEEMTAATCSIWCFMDFTDQNRLRNYCTCLLV